MIKYLRTILFLITGVAAPLFSDAKHIIGGEVTYECLGAVSGGQNYRITMRIYRDCDPTTGGADFDSPAYFAIYRGSENNNSRFSTLQVPYQGDFRIIPDTPACIKNVPFVCVEQATYVFEVVLPVSQSDSYFVVYQRCCRNNSIVNIYDPESVGATYAVEITPNAQTFCNDSPVFSEFPPVIICKDAPLIFDHSATDANGDQLVYSFCAPEVGGGPILTSPGYTECEGAQPQPPCAPPFTPVPFIQPQYSPGNPMGGNPQITINPVTGVITGVPNKVGRFVVGVCVDEYKAGVKISTIKRDFQFNVTDCDPSVLALIDGGDSLVFTQTGYYMSSCGEQNLFIQNNSVDLQFIKKFEWRFNLNGTPYVNDSDWSPTIPFPEPDRYLGQLLLNPGEECADTATIVVDIFPGVNANFSYEYDTCVAGPVAFTNLTQSEIPIKSYAWSFGVPNGTSDEENPEYLYQIPGEHPVRLIATDTNNCRDVIVKPIQYLPAPQLIIIQPSSFTGCAPGVITFNNLSVPIDSTYDIVWRFGNGDSIINVISPTYTYTEPGLYTVSIDITSPIGCFVSDTFENLIRVVPSPTADFSYNPEKVSNINPTVVFTDNSKDANRWFWQFDRFGTSNQINPVFTFPDTGLMRILLVVTHPEGCKDSLVKFIDVIPEITWFMPNAFTPNGDGVNDGFLGKGFLEGMQNFNMTIWNRWGELVFETSNPSESWSGRAQQNGGMSPAGVYVYMVSFTGPRGEKFEYRGYATLVR
jgi:gliding motility-associated-like protein